MINPTSMVDGYEQLVNWARIVVLVAVALPVLGFLLERRSGACRRIPLTIGERVLGQPANRERQAVALNRAAVAGPMPWNLPTGRVSTNAGPVSGGMTYWPLGLRGSDASLARNLL